MRIIMLALLLSGCQTAPKPDVNVFEECQKVCAPNPVYSIDLGSLRGCQCAVLERGCKP